MERYNYLAAAHKARMVQKDTLRAQLEVAKGPKKRAKLEQRISDLAAMSQLGVAPDLASCMPFGEVYRADQHYQDVLAHQSESTGKT